MALTRPAPAPTDPEADPTRPPGSASRRAAPDRATRAARAAALLALVAALAGTAAGLRGPADSGRLQLFGLELLAAVLAVAALAATRRTRTQLPQSQPREQPVNQNLESVEPESPAPAAHVRHAYVSLARRIQALINRQLRELREMEDRHGADPAVFADLMHLDHATALVGRLADSLAVLGGERAGRRWTKPAPLLDVMRGAMSRITEYRRVTIGQLPEEAAVTGDAVEGLVHALAELLDNAARYSPPDTYVLLSAVREPDGLIIEVEDHGVGLGPEARTRAALVLATEHAGLEVAALGTTPRLGLAVVGRLARATGFEVSLEPGNGGGVRARILVPAALVTAVRPDAPGPTDRVPRPRAEAGRGALAGRHAAPDPTGTTPPTALPDTVNGLPRRRRSPEQEPTTGLPQEPTPRPTPGPIPGQTQDPTPSQTHDPAPRPTTGLPQDPTPRPTPGPMPNPKPGPAPGQTLGQTIGLPPGPGLSPGPNQDPNSPPSYAATTAPAAGPAAPGTLTPPPPTPGPGQWLGRLRAGPGDGPNPRTRTEGMQP